MKKILVNKNALTSVLNDYEYYVQNGFCTNEEQTRLDQENIDILRENIGVSERKTDEDFDAKYTCNGSIESEAFADEEGREGMLETYSPDIDNVLLWANNPDSRKHVWTMVDGDDGMYLIAGYHLVNRIYYIITIEEWSDENEEYLFDYYGTDGENEDE